MKTADNNTRSVGIEKLHRELLEAWNTRDAERYAKLFTDDAIVIGFDGTVMLGRAQIAAELARIFRSHNTARYVRIVRQIRSLGPAIHLLCADVGMIPPGQTSVNPKVNAVQTLVGITVDDEWRAAQFQNTPAAFHERPDQAERLTAELNEVASAAGGAPARIAAENRIART